MKPDIQEEKLVKFAKQTLDHSIQNMDAATTARLQAARHKALTRSHKSIWGWGLQPTWAMAAVCLLIISLAIWNNDTPHSPGTLPFEDVEILANVDGWELYEELEFYTWLAENDPTG